MKDLAIALENRPGALAEMGEVLAKAGVSVEGGGVWLHGTDAVAHFLVADAAVARRALASAGITVFDEREVLVQQLNQDEPGQLGQLARRMADAGVNIETLYSDHQHQLLLVVDDLSKGRLVSDQWTRDRLTQAVSNRPHHYKVSIEWIGGGESGTVNYRSYKRDFNMTAGDKPPIAGSSDPAFRGDARRYNPEEMLVGSLSSCHMLTYLHLCAINGVVVLAYEDEATGLMREDAKGSGIFEEVVLNPRVIVANQEMLETAGSLHHQAHEMCFVARSVNFLVTVNASGSAS